MHEYTGNLHMHTPYSDGSKWHAEIAQDAILAGLDFIIVSDHNVWVSGIEGYYQNDEGKVLLLVGEEIHNPRRVPQASHFLAFGAERELSCHAYDTQELVDTTRDAGGLGFLAHPFDPHADAFKLESLGWADWDVEGYHGLEIWNFMSSFKGELTGKIRSYQAANEPDKYIKEPDRETLEKWDDLLTQGRRLVAIGGSDAHGSTYSFLSLTRVIFPYAFLFKTINTHLLLPKELSGDFESDKRMVLRALGRGNCWVGYDLPRSSRGFRFSGQSKTKGIMGEEIQLGMGATLQVSAPSRCDIRLIHNGKVIAECRGDTNLTFLPVETGAYRAECYFSHKGQKRGWIYSNPIYLI